LDPADVGLHKSGATHQTPLRLHNWPIDPIDPRGYSNDIIVLFINLAVVLVWSSVSLHHHFITQDSIWDCCIISGSRPVCCAVLVYFLNQDFMQNILFRDLHGWSV